MRFYLAAAVHMNNMNDPRDWNVRPAGREGGGGGGGDSKLNYALIWSMLGLAALRMSYTTLLASMVFY